MLPYEAKPLSEHDRLEIFRIATKGILKRYAKEIAKGMTDGELKLALEDVLGIFGGSGGPDSFSVTFTGYGLRIWGGRHTVNHVSEKPLFDGKRTVAMARQLYGIKNPDEPQLDLF